MAGLVHGSEAQELTAPRPTLAPKSSRSLQTAPMHPARHASLWSLGSPSLCLWTPHPCPPILSRAARP